MKRIDFFKFLGLASTSAVLPTKWVEANTFLSNTNDSTLLRGKVSSDRTPLRGVVVTNGFDVAITDELGNFTLSNVEHAKFVYISIPRGHAFPVENGIVQFYQPIKKEKADFQYDFNLVKLKQDDTKHCFVVWADTQVQSVEDVALMNKNAVPDLRQLLLDYNEGTLFHGIGCGDLVWDQLNLFSSYKNAIVSTGVPFFNVVGNHDRDPNEEKITYETNFGPTYYSFNRGAVHYVVLDDVFSLGEGNKFIGFVADQQLQWLVKDLSFIKKGSTVVVSLHIPTNTGMAKRLHKEAALDSLVSNREKLYKVLADYQVHFMSGHTHFNEVWEKKNVVEHIHGTVCGAWWTGPICSDGTPNGYGVYEVNNDKIEWYYKSIGKDRANQISLFAPGASIEYPNDILANVWNWDPQWKIEWMEDGVMQGLMTQVVGVDPLAEKLYKGVSLPQKHPFVEPVLTEHLFVARPSSRASVIEVIATDRFENVYRQRIQLGV